MSNVTNKSSHKLIKYSIKSKPFYPDGLGARIISHYENMPGATYEQIAAREGIQPELAEVIIKGYLYRLAKLESGEEDN